MSACPSCGRRHSAGDAFCAACGRSLQGGETPELTVELDGAHEVVLARSASPRRGWAVAAALALAAVVASVVVGGGDDGEAVTTTVPAATTSVGAGPATTSTSTTDAPTTMPPSTTISIGSAPLLGEPTGLGVLVRASDGDVHLVDLDAATVATQSIDERYTELRWSPVGMVARLADGGWRILASGAESIPLGPEDNYLGSDSTGRAWFRRNSRGAQEDLVAVRADPAATETLDVADGRYAVPDGLGGLVIDAPSGVYRWTDGAAVVRIADGRFEAAGGGVVVLGECDEAMRCRDVAADLRTGERTVLPDIDGVARAGYGYGAVSPDGRAVIAVRGTDQTMVAVGLDGTVIELGTSLTGCFSPACSGSDWSPDGRWLVWQTPEGTISAWRAGLAAPVRLELPVSVTNSFGVVRSAVGPAQLVAVGPVEELRAIG